MKSASSKHYIIDLSTTEILTGILVDNQFEILSPNIAWHFGFRQESDGEITFCFDEVFEDLDSNNPDQVRFPDLDLHLAQILDEEVLDYFFQALFHKLLAQLTDHDIALFEINKSIDTYIILPHHWKPIHRIVVRHVLRRGFPQLKLTAFLCQALCISTHKFSSWSDMIINSKQLTII